MPTFDPTAPGVLVMHSGGIDSTTALYLMLRDTDLPVHVHHIRMKFSHRAVQEWLAVVSQWDWLTANMRPFTTSAIIDPTEVCPPPGTGDELTLLPLAADKLAELPGFGRVMTGRCYEESLDDEGGAFAPESYAAFEARSGVPYTQARMFDPSRDWPKARKATELPPELLSTVWGCRGSFTADLGPCGGCIACQRYSAAGLWQAVYGAK